MFITDVFEANLWLLLLSFRRVILGGGRDVDVHLLLITGGGGRGGAPFGFQTRCLAALIPVVDGARRRPLELLVIRSRRLRLRQLETSRALFGGSIGYRER